MGVSTLALPLRLERVIRLPGLGKDRFGLRSDVHPRHERDLGRVPARPCAKSKCLAAGKYEDELYLGVIIIGEIERSIRGHEFGNLDIAAGLRAWLDRTTLVFADRPLDFAAEDARVRGRLSREIGHGGVDLMIAATALRHGAVVVTGNVDDFPPAGAGLESPV